MDHDPLCYVAKNGGNCCPWMPECDCQCMCDWILEIRNDEQSKTEDIHNALAEKMFKLGYDRALRKAREAVATLPRLTGVEAALAAIDALREEKK